MVTSQERRTKPTSRTQSGEALSVEAADRGLRNKGEVLQRLDVATGLSVPTG